MRKIQGHNYEDNTFESRSEDFWSRARKTHEELEGTRDNQAPGPEIKPGFMRLTDIIHKRKDSF